MRESELNVLASFDERSLDGIIDQRVGREFWSSLSDKEKGGYPLKEK